MMRFLILLGLILSLSFAITAQINDRPNYKLLWKISGKGLTKPSYLFGTMHVRDNRAFDFSDSVLLKINACDAFALEINPDSLGKEAVISLMGASDSQSLEKNMSEASYKNLDSIMKKKMGVSLKRFKSPLEVNAYLFQQFDKKEKSTFLDMWLYSVARSENKTMLGLEDLQVQLKLFQVEPEKQAKQLQQYIEIEYDKLEELFQLMIEKYHDGDIDAILTVSKQQMDPDQYDAFIKTRNKNMAENIVKAIHKRSTFLAVGAAHLPGEEGIVNLLKSRGYSVTAVPATFTGLAAQYVVKKKEYKWERVNLEEAGYSIEMPGKSFVMSNKVIPEPMQATVDLVNLSFFACTHFPVPANIRNKPSAEILDGMVKNMSTTLSVSKRKGFKVSNYEACEFESTGSDQHFKVRLIVGDRFIYYLMAGSTQETIEGDDTKRFFNSIKIFKPKEAAVPFELFEEKAGAFSVRVPGKVTEQEKNPSDSKSGKQHKIHIYFATDNQTGETFIFRYNDFLPGTVSSNDSIYMNSLPRSIMENMSGSSLTVKDTTLANIKGFKFDFDVTAQNLKVTGISLLRGNRYYLFFGVRLANSSLENTNYFFNSVSFLPYEKVETKSIVLDNEISLIVPVNFEQDSALTIQDDLIRYSFVDVKSGVQYSLQSENLGYYAQAESNESYFNKLESLLWEKDDSIISKQPIKDRHGYDYWIQSQGVNALSHVRFLFGNEKLVSLWSYLPDDYHLSSFHDEAYHSLLVKPSKWSLFSDKAEIILKDIASTDSITRVKANEALRDHIFSKKDLPKVYESLNRQYPDDNEGYDCVRCNLFQVLRKNNDETTPGFLKDLYGSLPANALLRDRAIGTLVSFKTEESIKTAINLMQMDNTRKFNSYLTLSDFYDSLVLMNGVANDLLELDSKFESSHTLYDLVKMALDSNALQADVKLKLIQQIESLGEQLLNEARANTNEGGHDDQRSKWLNYSDLVTALPFSEKVKATVLRLHQLHDTEIMVKTIPLLLKNQINVSAPDINWVAQDNLYRLQLYFALKRIKVEKKINKKYLTPRMVGDSDLVEYLNYEDGFPDSLQFVMEKRVTNNGVEHRIFIYRYYIREYEEWSHGISGPYPVKPKSDIERGEWTSSFYEDFESRDALMEFITKFVEEREGKLMR